MFPLSGRQEWALITFNEQEKEKTELVLAFDELLLLHQDERNRARVAHRLFPTFHYRSR